MSTLKEKDDYAGAPAVPTLHTVRSAASDGEKPETWDMVC